MYVGTYSIITDTHSSIHPLSLVCDWGVDLVWYTFVNGDLFYDFSLVMTRIECNKYKLWKLIMKWKILLGERKFKLNGNEQSKTIGDDVRNVVKQILGLYVSMERSRKRKMVLIS